MLAIALACLFLSIFGFLQLLPKPRKLASWICHVLRHLVAMVVKIGVDYDGSQTLVRTRMWQAGGVQAR